MKGILCAMIIEKFNTEETLYAHTFLKKLFCNEYEKRRTTRSFYYEGIIEKMNECDDDLLDFIYQIIVKEIKQKEKATNQNRPK